MGFYGEVLLAVVFLLSGYAAVFSLSALILGQDKTERVFQRAKLSILTAAAVLTAGLVLLVLAFLMDDFSTAVVSRYSNSQLGFFYKLSALWAGPEGSFLLWSASVFSMFAFSLAGLKTSDMRFNCVALSIGSWICLIFAGLLVFAVKPFAGSMLTIDEGAGLNPMLQNFWMIVHPPLLFMGYSAFLIPFVISLAAIFTHGTAGVEISRLLRYWLLFGVLLLGLGIITGAKWSYAELGWGGFWAWDPVENASLLPWLLAVAALHSRTGLRFSRSFEFWMLILAPAPFILSLLATFITRSGILSSVHSFGQGAMSAGLTGFILTVFLLYLIAGVLAAGRTGPIQPGFSTSILNRAGLLFWTDIILVLTAFVIGLATFWPVLCGFIKEQGSVIIISRLFYDKLASGAGIILVFLLGLSALAEFKKSSRFMTDTLFCSAVGFISYGLVLNVAKNSMMLSLAGGTCVFSFAAVLIKLYRNLKVGGSPAGSIAHLGLIIFVIAAGFSSADCSVRTSLAKKNSFTLGGKYELTYESFRHSVTDGLTSAGPEIVVRKNGFTKSLWPHNNIYPDGKSSAEVAIHTRFFEDIYLSFDGITQNGDVIITAEIKPLMLWLWTGASLIAAGLFLALFKKTGNKKQ